MAITVGCFALVDPFSTLDHQLDRIRDWGFHHADVTDTGDGAVLGTTSGSPRSRAWTPTRSTCAACSPSAGSPSRPTAPTRTSSMPRPRGATAAAEIIKAVRAAAAIGVPHVVTTEGEPVTPSGAV